MPALAPKITFGEGFVELYNEFCNSQKGQRLLELCGIDRKHLDVAQMSADYFEGLTTDVSVDPNANVGNGKCPNNFSCEVTKGVSKLTGFHLLWTRAAEEFSPERASELISRVWKGYLYFHDLTGHGVTAPYCFACTTLPLIFQGRPYGQLFSKPPKRLQSFVAQAIEFTMDMSQEFMGAVGLADFVVNVAMVGKNDGLDPDKPEDQKTFMNAFQQLIHVVNNKFRMSAQSPFTNVSLFDETQMKALFEHYEYPSGLKVVDHLPYIRKVQRIFMSFIITKDPISGLPYRFPIVTVNLTTKDGKILDEEFLRDVSMYNSEGLFNVYVTEGIGKVASCCRVLNDVKKMRERMRSDVWGNGGLNIGSTRVVTVNLARIAFESSGPIEFLSNLRRVLEDARDLLLVHRHILSELIDAGYLKFFKPLNWISLEQMFSTIGVLGLYEALSLFGEEYSLLKEPGLEWAERILKYIDDVADEFSVDTNIPFNVEQIPGEQAAITLANQDRVFFPDSSFTLYSNQSIPLWVDVDLITRARIDGRLAKCYTGGGITHLNIGSSVTQEQMKSLIQFAVKTGLDHFALNPVFSICEHDHAALGELTVCGVCGGKIVDHMTRVVGYFTKVGDWGKVRRTVEFPARTWKTLPERIE